MAKNRKNQADEIRFGPVLKVVLLCALICVAAIGYVWQQGQIERLGKQIKERENKLAQLINDNQSLSDQIGFLQTPVMLDTQARKLNLGLVPAQPFQVVRMVDLPSTPESGGLRQFALRPMAGGTP